MGRDARVSSGASSRPVELFVLGTSQAVAPSDVRERLHLDLHEVYSALGHLLTERGVLEEAVPVSTCARLELYAVAQDPDRAQQLLVRLMARKTGLPVRDLRSHAYALRGERAVRHLFRVAAGLDSVVHGEAQILGQVREAAQHPLSVDGKGPVLHRLFEAALATGKRVRTETEIGRGAASLVGAALTLLRRETGPLTSCTALVLGAGETGALVARLLRKAGVRRLVVANRTEETAREVAAKLGAEARSLDELPALFREADLVVGAVAGGELVITPEMVDAGPQGTGSPRYLLDLAHPRNFEPRLADVPGVRLIDLEDVFEQVEAARDARAAQVPEAERIVREQADDFVRWQRSREGVQVLRAVRDQVLEVARVEAERFARGRSPEEREEVARFARTLARTLLHPPTVALRQADPSNPQGRALLESAGVLFGVQDVRADRGETT
jgi:glutamyl-tRNA reductase